MNRGTELAHDLFKKINRIKPTRAIQGHGSFITIDFGQDFSEQIKTRSGPKIRYYGEWRLWVYMCAWRIDIDKKPCAGSEDSREKIGNCLTKLAQGELNEVVVLNNAFDLKLVFGKDIELRLFSFYTEDRTQWMLFTPEKKVFTAGPCDEWSYHDSDKPRPDTHSGNL
jgi:hypothetical protein